MTKVFTKGWWEKDLSHMVADMLSVAGSAALLLFGILSYIDGNYVYACSLFAFSLVSICNYIAFKRYKSWFWYRGIGIGMYSVLLVYLAITGGEQHTAFLWSYAYPLLAFPIIGHRYGKWFIGVVISSTILVMYQPSWFGATHNYPDVLLHRFTGSLIFVSLMGYMLEMARTQALQRSEEAMEMLRFQANRDELTEIYNRRGIKKKVQLELHRVARDKAEMSVVLCDIDLFKQINDQYGHDVGDVVLKRVAQLISNTVRVTDVVGRWGGEEFLILLPNTSLLKGYHLIERVREELAAEVISAEGHELQVSISCGICSTRFSSSFEDLIRAADVNLYEAKSEGRNCTRPVLAEVS